MFETTLSPNSLNSSKLSDSRSLGLSTSSASTSLSGTTFESNPGFLSQSNTSGKNSDNFDSKTRFHSFSHQPQSLNIVAANSRRRHSSPVTSPSMSSPTPATVENMKGSDNSDSATFPMRYITNARGSQIPTPTQKKTSQKRKTRVSDLISRLSSSTASSRAKAETAKAAIITGNSTPSTPTPPSHSTFASVFRSAGSVSKIVPAQNIISTPITSIPKLTNIGSTLTAELRKAQASNSTKITPSPTTHVSSPNQSSNPGTTTPRSSLPSNRRHSSEPRPLSTSQAIQQYRNSVNTYRRVSYNSESLSNPPSGPPPAPALRERNYKKSPSTSRSSSLTTEARRVRRPSSRASMGPSNSRMQNNRIEELRFKISELEEVLHQERVERETAEGWIEQIKYLEQALFKEKQEKEALVLKLKLYESSSFGSVEPPFIPESPSFSLSETETLADDDRRSYEAKIAELEAKIGNESETHFSQHLVALQTEISLLKGDNHSLKREKDSCQSFLKTQEESYKTLQGKHKKIESLVEELKEKIDQQQLEIVEFKGKYHGSEKLVSNKDEIIREKTEEIDDLKSRLREEKHIAQEAVDSVELVKAERDELQRQVQGFQASRRQGEKQISLLEKENRRTQRLNVALETSLQDLKVSLEEKAMENDELNRSILKVMEQANETIEGAKRHSLLISPSIRSPSIRSSSP